MGYSRLPGPLLQFWLTAARKSLRATYAVDKGGIHGKGKRLVVRYLETQNAIIKLVPEGGEVIEEGHLLHGVPLNHAVHEAQRP